MRHFIACLAFCLCLAGLTTEASAQADCDISYLTDDQWLNPDPTSLAEVHNGEMANNCDFHVFSWQWFSYLMNPYDSELRNFENRAVHPVVDLDTCASIQAGQMPMLAHGGVIPGLPKQPDISDQASNNALYDKNGNIVFYNRNFTVNECGITAAGNFPDAGTANPDFPTGVDQVVELKTAWQILDPAGDNSSYYTRAVTVEGERDLLLGLIGFHIVVNTGLHPEFIWATFEHVANAPNCTVNTNQGFQTTQQPHDWALVGPTCNACVQKNYEDGTDLLSACATECSWNPADDKQPAAQLDPQGNTILTGTPSDICLVEYLGTGDATTTDGMTNIANIELLNSKLSGATGLFAMQGSDETQVLQNYILAGAVWTDMTSFVPSDDKKYKTDITGSTALANASMESFSQPGSNSTDFFDIGCFSCHGDASPTNTAAASHLLSDTAGGAPGLIERCNVPAGAIDSQTAAGDICPQVCGSADNWNGNWTTLVAGSASVCGCNTCVAN